MGKMIPLNGRIAIIDDVIEQALPLMRVLSKNRIPYVFYKGNRMEDLPDKPDNDIRILFLDLNLLDGRDAQPKDIQSALYSVIVRIISPSNYPYVIVLWSRQEKQYKSLLEELFADRLKQCAPIAILEWIKSDYFPNFADIEENNDNEDRIFDELKKVLSTIPAYTYLLQWENCIHNSADKTIQAVFHDIQSTNDWQDNANCVLDMFAHSYLEKRYSEASKLEKVRSSLLFFNDVYYDSLEDLIQNEIFENVDADIDYDTTEKGQRVIKSNINYSILFSKKVISIKQPGCVFIGEDGNLLTKDLSFAILNDSLDTQRIHEQVEKENAGKCKKELKKLFDNCFKRTKQEIKDSFIQACGVVVTPQCDYAQNKTKYDRVLLGIIISADHKNELDIKSDSIYVSPVFTHNSQPCILVLHFRYFKAELIEIKPELTPLFRLRNSILSEIQSKLARHISRQGILNL